MRLRPNILEQSCVVSIKGTEQLTSNQFSFDLRPDNIDQQDHTHDHMAMHRPIMDRLSCIDCGTLFASPVDIQKHAKRGCLEADDSDEERPVKRQKWVTLESDQSDYSDSVNDDDEGSDNDWDEDEPGFQQLVHTAFDQYNDIYGDKVDKLMEEENITEEATRRDVIDDIIRSRYRKSLVGEYKTFINMARLMRNSSAHNEIR